MNRKAKLSIAIGLFIAFTFAINSLIKGELETAEGIQTTLIACGAAGITCAAGVYFFMKDSQIDKIWGKKKEE